VKNISSEIYSGRVIEKLEVELIDFQGEVVEFDSESLVKVSITNEEASVSGIREVKAEKGRVLFTELTIVAN